MFTLGTLISVGRPLTSTSPGLMWTGLLGSECAETDPLVKWKYNAGNVPAKPMAISTVASIVISLGLTIFISIFLPEKRCSGFTRHTVPR
jgi:hypothetical protein